MPNRTKKLNQRYQLQFSAKLSAITLVLSFILVYLGAWQIDRGLEKKKILFNLATKAKSPPINFENLNHPDLRNDRFTAVKMHGLFMNDYSFLLDNQISQHKVGFRVMTPLQIPNLQQWIVIDRGWIPLTKDRSILPKIEPIYGLQEVVGIINTIPAGIILKKDRVNPNATWPILIQALDYGLIMQQVQHPVFDFVVQLNTKDLNFGISSYKHWGYAAQWFLFAFILLIYFLIASIKRVKIL